MKKILLIANEYTTILDFRTELLEGLLNEHYEVVVALPYDKHCEKFKELGCKVIDLYMSRKGMNPRNELKVIKDIERIVKTEKPDCILTFTIKPNVYGGYVAGKLGIPYIANVTGLGTAVESGGLTSKIAITMYRIGLKKVSIVYFQNDFSKDFMIEHKIVKNNYKRIPGSGVNLNKYQILSYPDDKEINFVYVSRVMREKGFDEYVYCAKDIKEKYKNVNFHVCGMIEQGYDDEVKKLNDEGIIIYHGQVDYMPDIYKMAHCTVNPSFYPEGLSNILLESLASGRPIITTDKPGCKELVVDGVNGYMVKQKNSNSLLEAINKFLSLSNDERKKMGLTGRAYIEKNYDRNIVVKAYKEDIKKLINK